MCAELSKSGLGALRIVGRDTNEGPMITFEFEVDSRGSAGAVETGLEALFVQTPAGWRFYGPSNPQTAPKEVSRLVLEW